MVIFETLKDMREQALVKERAPERNRAGEGKSLLEFVES